MVEKTRRKTLSSYWMILRERKDTGTGERKH
jgi:hypothetical protein